MESKPNSSGWFDSLISLVTTKKGDLSMEDTSASSIPGRETSMEVSETRRNFNYLTPKTNKLVNITSTTASSAIKNYKGVLNPYNRKRALVVSPGEENARENGVKVTKTSDTQESEGYSHIDTPRPNGRVSSNEFSPGVMETNNRISILEDRFGNISRSVTNSTYNEVIKRHATSPFNSSKLLDNRDITGIFNHRPTVERKPLFTPTRAYFFAARNSKGAASVWKKPLKYAGPIPTTRKETEKMIDKISKDASAPAKKSNVFSGNFDDDMDMSNESDNKSPEPTIDIPNKSPELVKETPKVVIEVKEAKNFDSAPFKFAQPVLREPLCARCQNKIEEPLSVREVTKSAPKWSCPTCMVSNDASATKCPCCATPKDGKSTIKVSSQLKGDTFAAPAVGITFGNATSKWNCSTCMVPNEASSAKCVCCETPKEGEVKGSAPPIKSLKGDTFAAPVVNNGFSFGTTSVPPTAKWNCSTCMVPNEASSAKCVCCETPKDGEVKSSASAAKVLKGDSFAAPVVNSGFTFGTTAPVVAKDIPKAVPVVEKPIVQPPVANGVTSSKPPAAPGLSKWTCSACMVPNDATAQNCVCCETPREGGSLSSAPAIKTLKGDNFASSVVNTTFAFGVNTSGNASSAATSLFGGTQSVPSTTGATSLFGKPIESAPAKSLFENGAPATETKSLFGSKPTEPATSFTGMFGNTSTQAPAPAKSIFNTPTPAAEIVENGKAANEGSKSVFGNSAANFGNGTMGSSIFGNPSQATSIFGNGVSKLENCIQPTPTPPTAPNMFGSQPTATPPKSLFGSVTPAVENGTETPKTLFGATTGATSIFGSQPAQSTTSNMFGSQPTTTPAPISFGSQPTTTKTSIFGSAVAESEGQKSLFGSLAPTNSAIPTSVSFAKPNIFGNGFAAPSATLTKSSSFNFTSGNTSINPTTGNSFNLNGNASTNNTFTSSSQPQGNVGFNFSSAAAPNSMFDNHGSSFAPAPVAQPLQFNMNIPSQFNFGAANTSNFQFVSGASTGNSPHTGVAPSPLTSRKIATARRAKNRKV
uniref:RanBP2-type domain-containing protein n=1 Tax=Rhabditophanes sp. KR3021 TaxID=114890 RepID=A0AC35TXU6_9BILA